VTAIDSQTDVPLTAIAALVRGAIEADIDDNAVLAVYEDPRALNLLAASKLPALCIYRVSEVRRLRESGIRVHDITVAFDYVLPATNIERRPARWPALQKAWSVISDAVLTGSHSAVQSGIDVLDAASTEAQENSARVTYALAEGGGENYPFLRGSIVVTYEPTGVDVTTLDDFLEFYTAFDNPDTDINLLGASTPDGAADSTDIVTLPAWGS
jgi:hypothetical protein